MQPTVTIDPVRLARYTGWSLIASIVLGILVSVFFLTGIDINLNADVEGTARNMLDAEIRLRAKAYFSILSFGLAIFSTLGLFLLLTTYGRLLAAWSALLGIAASIVILLGAVAAMIAAEIAGDAAYRTLADEPLRLLLVGLQASTDYTSFHLALVMGSIANAGFFFLFVKSNLIPKIIAGFGLFASLLVAFMIVARDFIPALANNTLSISFILANLIAMISTGLYLSIKGVRTIV